MMAHLYRFRVYGHGDDISLHAVIMEPREYDLDVIQASAGGWESPERSGLGWS